MNWKTAAVAALIALAAFLAGAEIGHRAGYDRGAAACPAAARAKAIGDAQFQAWMNREQIIEAERIRRGCAPPADDEGEWRSEQPDEGRRWRE